MLMLSDEHHSGNEFHCVGALEEEARCLKVFVLLQIAVSWSLRLRERALTTGLCYCIAAYLFFFFSVQLQHFEGDSG